MPETSEARLIMDVIVPARNEAENIPALMAAMPREVVRHIVVADNGSTDQTAALADQHGAVVVPEPRRGYGYACLAGIRWIGERPDPPDAVAFVDADLADDPGLLAKLSAPIAADEVDFVIGARPRLAEPGSLTVVQRFGNWLSCFLIRILTGKRFTDLGPFRILRWKTLTDLEMQDKTWGWTVEMQYKAAVRKVRHLDIDVPYRPRRAGQSKISGNIIGSIKAGWKILWTLLVLRLTFR